MYDPEVTERFLVEQQKATPTFHAERHDVSDIVLMTEHLANKWDPDKGEQVEDLTEDETRWIENERLLCTHDFLYWSSRYAFIVDWEKKLVRFTPNIAQQIVLDQWSEMERNRWAIMNLQLKGRQSGVSTNTELAVAHRLQFYPDVDAVVASSTPTKSDKLKKMIRLCWEHQPWWLMPRPVRIEDGMPAEFEHNSALTIQAGNQFSGIARGSTPSVIHLCCAPETLVRVANGQLVPIREVKAGDQVLTDTGEWTTVKAVACSARINEPTVDLWVWNTFAPLRTTRDHRVLTPSGWKSAEEIHEGDEIVYPIRPITETRKRFQVERREAGRPVGRHVKPVSHDEPLNRAWGYALGLYLAEGTLQTNSRIRGDRMRHTALVISCDVSEVDRFSERLRTVVSDRKIGVRLRTVSRSRQLYVADAGLARWIYDEFGSTDTKHVPDWAWEAGREFCLGLVEGYLDGDGHWTDGNEIYASSVRMALPIQFRELVASLGCGWSGITYRSAGVFYERNCRAQWTWILSGPAGQKLRQALNRPSVPTTKALHWRILNERQLALQVERAYDGFSEEFYDLEVVHERHAFTTLQGVVSNSEVCEFANPEEDIDASLLFAIHETPDVLFVIESTALGRDNWFHKKWRSSKEGWDTHRSRLCPLFLPFYVARDLYPDESWLRKHPVPFGWQPADQLLAYAERAKDFVRANTRLRKFMGQLWVMPKEQLWWYDVTRKEYQDNNELNRFLAEVPADDFEAFQSTNRSAFPIEITQAIRERVKGPLGVYKLVGVGENEHDIPVEHQPSRSEIDTSRQVVPIECNWSNQRYRYQLVPVKFEGYSNGGSMGKVFIFEAPEENTEYGFGVDTAEGVGGDRTVIEGLRKGDLRRPDAQVFELASDYINGFEFWPWCLALGTLYSTPIAGERHQARSSIECRFNGDSLQNELRKRGWSNHHIWSHLDKKRMHLDRAQKIGFFTNPWSRSTMLDMLRTYINRDRLLIRSPMFVEEMESLEKDDFKQSMRAAYGGRDDRVMALGFILFSFHIYEWPNEQGMNTADQREALAEQDDPVYDPGYQGRDYGDHVLVPHIERAITMSQALPDAWERRRRIL